MQSTYTLQTIARIRSDFPDKFGIPRQSGMIENLKAKIIFEPGFRQPEAFRGLSDYSHIWLIWGFSENIRSSWSPSVRPPRLGGNQRMGVFATRSPFRPNPIGLSSVILERVEFHPENGPILHVCGADLMDGTPIFDIKPYLTYTDSHPEASEGFAAGVKDYRLNIDFPPELLKKVPEDRRETLKNLLAQDPRPSYQTDPKRIYGIRFAGLEIKFYVKNHVLHVWAVERDDAL